MAFAMLVNTVGSGFYATVSVLFFTQVVGMSATAVGAGLGFAAVIGVIGSVPIGHAADRYGPKLVYVLLLAVEGVAMASFPLVRGLPAFLAMIAVVILGQRAAPPIGAAVVSAIVPAATRTRSLAYLRAVANVGIATGGFAAGVSLQLNTPLAYSIMVFCDAATYLLAAALLCRLPRVSTVKAPSDWQRSAAIRDRPYLTIAWLVGLLSYQYDIVLVVLPLWVVRRTDAPRPTVSILLVVSAVIVASLQVRATRNLTDATSAGRFSRRAGILFWFSCAAFGLAGFGGPVAAFGVLVLAMAIHTAGELLAAASGFELSFAFAPPHATGAYQTVFSMVSGLIRATSPYVLLVACLRLGIFGWLTVGTGLLAAGAATPRAVEWVQRRRAQAISDSVSAEST